MGVGDRVGALVQVSGRRSKMGPILFKGATPSTMAHEVGHYFDLSRRVDPGFIRDVVKWCSARTGL